MAYKVCIVGGGFCGASLACALHQQFPDWRIAVVEKGSCKPMDDAEAGVSDGRLIALTYGSYRLYQRLGVFSSLEPYTSPLREVHVSERGRFGALHVSAAQWGLPVLGYTVPGARLKQVLHSELQSRVASSLLTLYEEASVIGIQPVGGQQRVLLEQAGKPLSLTAALVIAADGRDSMVRSQLGIAVREKVYQQSVVIVGLEVSRAHQGASYERVLPEGPLAVLPAGPNHCTAIWTLSPKQAAYYNGLDDGALLAIFQEHLGSRLGELKALGQRYCYPLFGLEALETVRPGVILMGNAVMTLHPIAAQGLNLALRDVHCLTKALAAQVEKDRSIVDVSFLREYAKSRAIDRQRTRRLTHGLLGLLGIQGKGFRGLRGLGLGLLDWFPGAQRRLFRMTT